MGHRGTADHEQMSVASCLTGKDLPSPALWLLEKKLRQGPTLKPFFGLITSL